VHNVRRGGKVRQLHLARLGDRAAITDEIVRAVSKKHPFVELNWRTLRDQLNNQIDLSDPQSPAVQKLVHSLRNLNLDLADFFPPVLRLSESPAVARELLLQLRLLQSTIQVKLDQFARKDELKRLNRTSGRIGSAHPGFRDARRRSWDSRSFSESKYYAARKPSSFRRRCVPRSSAGRRRANARRALPGVHRRTEFPGSPGWQPVVPRAHGLRQTRIVEAAAEILFGSPRAVIKIDCAEFQHSHEIAKLIGLAPRLSWAPRNASADYPGSAGGAPQRQAEALVPALRRNREASDALWQLLLGMLDKATLTLGDNRRVTSRRPSSS